MQLSLMIVSLEPREFIPCGQLAYSQHPGIVCLHFDQTNGLGQATKSLSGTLSKVTLDDKPKVEEKWKLRSHDNDEEELFMSGHTVVWSRGGVVLKSYTVDSPVKQVVWCNFPVASDDPYQFDLPQVKKDDCFSIKGIAVVASGTVHMFTEDGETYDTALPFQVRNVWNFKFGLLFERMKPALIQPQNLLSTSHTANSNDLTTVFCLQHPLGEFSPIITKTQGIVKYMNRSQDSVVYCEDDFVMTCDERHGLHTVWKARKVSYDDVNVLQTAQLQQNPGNSICHLSMSSPVVSPYLGSYRGSPITGHSSTSALMGNGVSGFNKTPRNKNPSFAHMSFTPLSNKAFSPSAGSLLHQSHNFSPLRHSPHLTRSPRTPMSHESLCLNSSVNEVAEPLRPELCFDHMWTETITSTREGLSTGRAVKVFRTKDLCGQTYLAYHIDSISQLRLVRYSSSNDQAHYIFGAVTQMQAKDAIQLEDLNMFALLDLGGLITLFSGLLKIVKVNVSGLPLASLGMSQGLRNTTSIPNTPQPISTPAHPSRPTSAMANMDEVGHLSPVPELAMSTEDISIITTDEFAFSACGFPSKLVGLPHVVGSTILVELVGGNHYRVDIPPLCSTELVKTCLKAIQYMLPSDSYLAFAIKWYSMRHAPGALNGRRAEWSLFMDCLQDFLGYMGSKLLNYKASKIEASAEFDLSASPVIAAKKARPMDTSELGTKSWDYLMESKYEKEYNESSELRTDEYDDAMLLPSHSQSFSTLRRKSLNSSLAGDANFLLHQQHLSVFYALHLVYEEQKLSTTTWKNVSLMSSLLYRLASDLHLPNFMRVYALDSPLLLNKFVAARIPEPLENEFECKNPGLSIDASPSVLENLDCLIEHKCSEKPFHYIPNVTKKIEWIFKIYDCLFNQSSTSSVAVLSPLMKSTLSSFLHDESGFVDKQSELTPSVDRLLHYMVSCDIDETELLTWPPGILLPIRDYLNRCSANPDLTLPTAALKLLGRIDLVSQTLPSAGDWKEADLCPSTDPLRFVWAEEDGSYHEVHTTKDEVLDALEKNDQEESTKTTTSEYNEDNVTRLLFPSDHRLADAYNLLDPTKPIPVLISQEAGVDDREFMEQKEARLLQLVNRRMALSVGRGMLKYRSLVPSVVEPLRMTLMELTGKDANNATVVLSNNSVEVPSDMVAWAVFHSGVADALSIEPDENIMSWVHLNKQASKESSEKVYVPFAEHAGALFGLGLNHHLQDLETLDVHDYLQKSHEMTTVGLLLGLAADKCGSCDMATMRVLSVHVSALLPDSSTQLDIPFRVQTAAVMAVGLLYLGSGQRLVAEVMLKEIDRSPSSESDISIEREAYSLSAGFALGMVTLGKGDNLVELSDLNMSDKLFHLMTGKHKRDVSSNYADTYGVGASIQGGNFNQILEGDRVNTEITCPGATIALCLMFLKTNNLAVANWFIAPDTISLLEAIKPQHLMLRVMTRALILWDNIVPSVDWVESHVSPVIRCHLDETGFLLVSNGADASQVDEQTIFQCYASIITGACIALGLRFAGSQEKAAFETLHHYVQFFLSLAKKNERNRSLRPLEYFTKPSSSLLPLALCSQFDKIIGQRLYETCLTSCLISLCMVVAGSGNLTALQICRFLHVSVDNEISYGMQMANHMALGLLFLGNCRYTLETSHKAIATLLVSIYPVFPSKCTDNRYHLQAFRHFYVMAIEKRLLVPIDSTTQRPCNARVSVQYMPDTSGQSTVVQTIAPCLLPEIRFLHSITVDGSRHLPMEICVQTQAKKLKQFLNDGMYVQLKSGCLSYIQDPKGHCSFLNRHHLLTSLNRFQENIRNGQVSNILYDMCNLLSDDATMKNDAMSQTMLLLEDRRHDNKSFFIYLSLLQVCWHLKHNKSPDVLSAWQIRLARNYLRQTTDKSEEATQLMLSITTKLNKVYDQFVAEHKLLVETVVFNRRLESSRILTRSQSFHDTELLLVDSLAMPKLKQLTCYLIYNSIQLKLGPIGNVGASPSKRRSKVKNEENNLIAALTRLKQMKNLGLSTETCLQLF